MKESYQPGVPVDATRVSAEGIPPVVALKQIDLRLAIAAAVSAGVIVSAALLLFALWLTGFPTVKRDGTVSTATFFELLKLVLAIVAGIGGVAALVVAYRRQRVAETANRLQEVATVLAQQADTRAASESDRSALRMYNERFATAAEQLGSDKAAIRLAGVYAMAGLADDWLKGRQTCIDVLCAYLRMPYGPNNDGRETANAVLMQSPAESEESACLDCVRTSGPETEVRATIVQVIRGHLRQGESPSWKGNDFDLTGAHLVNADLSEATFEGGRIRLRGARFCGSSTSFYRSIFSGADVEFNNAAFVSNVIFTESAFLAGSISFHNTSFGSQHIEFIGANFAGADVWFGSAEMRGYINFGGAKFTGGKITFFRTDCFGSRISFDRARLDGGQIVFHGTYLHGARISFNDAERLSGDIWYDNPRFDHTTFVQVRSEGDFTPDQRTLFDGFTVIEEYDEDDECAEEQDDEG